MKIKMLVEIDYDCGESKEERQWFMDEILLNKSPEGRLLLHSNETGDTLGEVNVLEVHPF